MIPPDQNIVPGSEADSVRQEELRIMRLARHALELREELLAKGRLDPTKGPTPQNLAKGLGVPVEEVQDILWFAENELGDFEANEIMTHATDFIDDSGNLKPRDDGYGI